MSYFLDSLESALYLLVSFDSELFSIVWVSVQVSTASTISASLLGLPTGMIIALSSFPGKRLLITILNTLLALPTVIIGLFAYAFLSRRGIFGPFDLLYTQHAVIIGQVILILPMVTTFTIAAINRIDDRYRKTAVTLGANRLQTALIIAREARFGLIAGLIAGYGRVISEVGISMMLGGNVKGFTRTMTTAMALEYDKGEFSLSIALGVILMILAFGINLLFQFIQGKTQS